MKTISFRVSDEIAALLDEQAKAADVTRTDYLIGRITEQNGTSIDQSAEVARLAGQIETLQAEILVLQQRQFVPKSVLQTPESAPPVIQEAVQAESVIQSSFNDPARVEKKAAKAERKAALASSVASALPPRGAYLTADDLPTYTLIYRSAG